VCEHEDLSRTEGCRGRAEGVGTRDVVLGSGAHADVVLTRSQVRNTMGFPTGKQTGATFRPSAGGYPASRVVFAPLVANTDDICIAGKRRPCPSKVLTMPLLHLAATC